MDLVGASAEETQVLRERCTYCWAAPEDWCRRPSGVRTITLHKQRWDIWRGDREPAQIESPPSPPTEEDWVVMMRCLHCWALPGHWCTNNDGSPASELHQWRWKVWRNSLIRVREERHSSRIRVHVTHARAAGSGRR